MQSGTIRANQKLIMIDKEDVLQVRQAPSGTQQQIRIITGLPWYLGASQRLPVSMHIIIGWEINTQSHVCSSYQDSLSFSYYHSYLVMIPMLTSLLF